MNTTVEVKVKNVYGNDLIYPVNDTAHKFVNLLGKKTFSDLELNKIKLLGFTIIKNL